MNNNHNTRGRSQRPDGPTAAILLRPNGAPEEDPDNVELTAAEQREFCCLLAARLGLTVIGESHFDEHPRERNRDGFWIVTPERPIGDVLLHASMRCGALPGLTALVTAQETAHDGTMTMQIVSLPAEATTR